VVTPAGQGLDGSLAIGTAGFGRGFHMRWLIVGAVLALVAAGGIAPAAVGSEAGPGATHPGRLVAGGPLATSYQDPDAVSGFLQALAKAPAGEFTRVEGRHLSAVVAVSHRRVSPGGRFSVVFEVEPRPGIHVYARGKHDYRPFAPLFDPHTALVLEGPTWPAAREYYFAPLDERVPVYDQPFRVIQPVLVKLRDGNQLLKASRTLAITGALSYQACDDSTCFLPEQVPFKVSIGLEPAASTPVAKPGQ
jgi:hypothetical protein